MNQQSQNKPDDAPQNFIMTGQSQITINKKWVAIIVAILIVFTLGVGGMYHITATARPATTHTGGY